VSGSTVVTLSGWRKYAMAVKFAVGEGPSSLFLFLGTQVTR
jgi:hypothetical protein